MAWRRALTIVGHGQDGDLGDGAVSAFHSAGAFIDGGQICVHVAGKPSTPGDFLSGSGDLNEEELGEADRGCKQTFPFPLYLNHIWENVKVVSFILVTGTGCSLVFTGLTGQSKHFRLVTVNHRPAVIYHPWREEAGADNKLQGLKRCEAMVLLTAVTKVRE